MLERETSSLTNTPDEAAGKSGLSCIGPTISRDYADIPRKSCEIQRFGRALTTPSIGHPAPFRHVLPKSTLIFTSPSDCNDHPPRPDK